MKPIRQEVMNYEEFVPYLGQPRNCIVCGSSNKKEWARQGPFRAVECQNCSLVWMDPFLTEEGFTKYYTNYIQFRLEDKTKMEQRQKMYELDRTFLEQFTQEGTLLDVGCSEGLFLEVLSQNFDKYGIDVDPEAIERGRKLGRVPADHLKVGALGDDDFEPESFDVITMRGTIEHLPNPRQAIARVAELLKDNGIFYITATPNVMSFCAYLYREKWNQFDPVQHIYHFSAKTLAQLTEQYGLSLVAQTYPYLETPYADLQKDHEKVIHDYQLIQAGRRDEVTRSSAFWGNMMTLVFRKKSRPRQSDRMRYYARYHNPQHTYVIAEVGLCHNGSVAIAKQLIDVAALAGADAVKFQKRTVDTLAIKSVLDAKDDRFPEFGQTYRQIREHIELSEDEYREIKEYAEFKNIDFLCTAFDIEAARFLERLGVPAYKLASHSLTNLPLLEFIAALGKPTILSTGMGEWDDIDRAVDIFRQQNTPLVLLHCVSAYPTPVEESNLTMIAALRERYNLPIGYSGHELGYLPTLTAVAMGARVVERHITLDKSMIGFDHKISLEPHELIQMVKDIRNIDKAKGEGVKQVSAQEKITSDKYHVSMVSQQTIPKGTIITPSMITYKNPGTGVSPKDAHLVFEKRAVVDIPADEIIKPEMVA